MKTLVIALATTALTATVASAAVSVKNYDANGDRFASFAEVTAVNPTINRNDFREIDTNRDNRLSSSEILTAGAQETLNRGTTSTGTFRSTTDLSGGAFVSYAQLQNAYPGLPVSQARIIDVNKDGRVSAAELADPQAQADLSVYEDGSQVVVSLSAVDANGSGFAEFGELKSVYPNLSRNDLRQIDVNRDGRLSFTELYDDDAVEILGRSK